MTNYRHNWRDGYHPFLAVPGGSGIRPWGMDVPALGPVQGGGSWAPCQTQVIDWPWSTDEAGVSFDQSNLYGVRTRCWSTDDIGNPGDRDWWVAVPKSPSVAYTRRGRSHVQPMIYDHLGDYPFQGVVVIDGFGYSIRPVRWRTPTGQYPTNLAGDGYLWTPMNLNRLTIGIDPLDLAGGFTEADDSGIASGFDGPGCTIPVSSGPNLTRSWDYFQVARHVGFRGGKMLLYSYTNQTCAPFSSGTARIVIGWDDALPSTTALPPNIAFDQSYAFSDLIDIGSGGGYNWRFELTVNLPSMLIPTSEGEPKYWIFWIGSCMTGSNIVNLGATNLSPRTDVPLWYWASQRNRIAPGGVLV